MAFRSKIARADEPARRFERLTREILTKAAANARRVRPERVRAERTGSSSSANRFRLHHFAAKKRAEDDIRPVSQAEWGAASGDTA
jgi:hypothetical protein